VTQPCIMCNLGPGHSNEVLGHGDTIDLVDVVFPRGGLAQVSCNKVKYASAIYGT